MVHSNGSEIPVRVSNLDMQDAASPHAGRVYAAGPPDIKRDTMMVFFHGGGFTSGNLDVGDRFLRNLVGRNTGLLVLAADYTLARVRPFPAASEDAYAALVWAKKNKSKLGWTGKQLIVSGVEAGANLAAVSALVSRDRNGPVLAAQILIMPMLDADLSTCSMRNLPNSPEVAEIADACASAYREYLPNAIDRGHPYASPLRSSRLKNLPPALILFSDDSPLRDEAEQYAAKLIACGVNAQIVGLPRAPLHEAVACNNHACQMTVSNHVVNFLQSLN